jgi:hypothetical protein
MSSASSWGFRRAHQKFLATLILALSQMCFPMTKLAVLEMSRPLISVPMQTMMTVDPPKEQGSLA